MTNERDDPEIPEGFVLIGRIVRAHGNDGTLRIESLTDNPTRFLPNSVVDIGGFPWVVDSYRPLPGRRHALLRLNELNDAADARQLPSEWLLAPVDPEADLEPGEYYHYQLVGLSVTTEQGEHLGTLHEVLITGSNDVYVVKSEAGTELLLPAIAQVIKQIDLSANTMLVHLLDGLR